ncbi:hypothetical protein NEFER03_1658 [Nematocida sp. LUAm3]|nr:hypothetical protein NEFER03_1658 [Nematocida sp. LUAm3]KAI5174682.1 hypothetical protein NEFER02_0792 [Nematocida sp. LUAm2]KAI5177907.1 hypothetical protein NEFER01_1109 [Nematocida sp. LUAm1]
MEEAPILTYGHLLFRMILDGNAKSIKRRARRDIRMETEENEEIQKMIEREYTESEVSSKLLISSFYFSLAFFGIFVLSFSLIFSYFLPFMAQITAKKGIFVNYWDIMEKLPWVISGALVICFFIYIGLFIRTFKRISLQITENTTYAEKKTSSLQAAKLLVGESFFIFLGMLVLFLLSFTICCKGNEKIFIGFEVVALAVLCLCMLLEIIIGVQSFLSNPEVRKQTRIKKTKYILYLIILSLILISIIVCVMCLSSMSITNSIQSSKLEQ